MKYIVIISVLAILSQATLCNKGNDLRLLNLDYLKPDTKEKVHYVFKSAISISCEANEVDVDQTVFNFSWNYASDAEKTTGHSIVEKSGEILKV